MGLFVLAMAVFVFVFGTILLTHLLGPKKESKGKMEAFECGVPSQGNARVPFSVSYFAVAALFVLFDVEIIFFYPWAIHFRALGWMGFFAMLGFALTVCVALVYLHKNGVLDFAPDRRKDLI